MRTTKSTPTRNVQAAWEEFLRWLMQPEIGDLHEDGITFSIVVELYRSAVDQDVFWERCGQVMNGYRTLPGAMHHLPREIKRLGLSSGYRLPKANLSPSVIPVKYTVFLHDMRWHRNSSFYFQEQESAEHLLGLIEAWAETFFGDPNHDQPAEAELEGLLLWQRIRLAIEKGNASLVDGAKNKTIRRPIRVMRYPA